MVFWICRSNPAAVIADKSLSKDSRKKVVTPRIELPEDFLATDERGFFTGLNSANDGDILEAFPESVAQQILALCQNFGHGGFKESFEVAFFDGGHSGNLWKKGMQIKKNVTRRD